MASLTAAASFARVAASATRRPVHRDRASVVVSAAGDLTFPRAVRFRPCIDIHQGRVKQFVGGTLKDSDDGDAASETPETNFETETSSAEFARMYQRDGIYGGHVIMLGRNEETRAAALGTTGTTIVSSLNRISTRRSKRRRFALYAGLLSVFSLLTSRFS